MRQQQVLVQELVLQQQVLVQELVLLFYRKRREQQQPSELRVRKTCSLENSLDGKTTSGNCRHIQYVGATE
jgi:hypothetical protein